MVWCNTCAKQTRAERDDVSGYTCCTTCGRVLEDSYFSSEPTFSKDASGQSHFSGNIVRAGQYSRLRDDPNQHYSVSHERTLERGRNEIRDIADSLSISGRDDAVNAAHRLYVLAVEKSFTKGRRTQQVAASCLYIVCREENKPLLLIDFSDSLQISVYMLGAVFLQLCRLLRLEEHPIIQKPVDPSLFIHRFTDQLLARHPEFQSKHHAIANMALRIVSSMKRDWIQTGRRPSGITGAAIFIASHVHGFKCSKSEVVSVVHVCENTLSKRLREFGDTECGTLTPEEFEVKARETEMHSIVVKAPVNNGDTSILCEHRDLGGLHFAHGLCRTCYDDFVKVSGGIDGGSDPPAFQVAEKRRRLAQARKRKLMRLDNDDDSRLRCGASSDNDILKEEEDDLDDEEINAYINNDEEVKLKTAVWTEMNKEYIEEMEAKEAATAASEAAEAAKLASIASNGTPEEIAAAAAVAAVLKSKKPRKLQRRGPKVPAESPAEAARQMLESKRMGSKFNLDVLESLFESKSDQATPAKSVHEEAKAEGTENAAEEKEEEAEEDMYFPEEEEYYEEY